MKVSALAAAAGFTFVEARLRIPLTVLDNEPPISPLATCLVTNQLDAACATPTWGSCGGGGVAPAGAEAAETDSAASPKKAARLKEMAPRRDRRVVDMVLAFPDHDPEFSASSRCPTETQP